VTIKLRDGSAESVQQTVLAHQKLDAHNTFDKPSEVVGRSSATTLSGATFALELPPASVTRLDVKLG
jgi:alpha-L-arabinofuranosidase